MDTSKCINYMVNRKQEYIQYDVPSMLTAYSEGRGVAVPYSTMGKKDGLHHHKIEFSC